MADQFGVHHQNSSAVIKDVAVVRGRENGDQLAVGEELVAILDHLVGADNQVKLVLHEEALHYVGSKGEADTSIVGRPRSGGLIRIRPKQIAQQPIAGHIGGAIQPPDVIQVIQIRTQSAVDAKDAIGYDGGHWHAVIAIDKGAPQLDAISSLALVEKTIYPIQIRRFMIAAQQEESLRIAKLIGQQQR